MIRKIAWKNILNKPLNSALCVSLLLFGVAMISLLIVIQSQVEKKFKQDLKDIDLVVGAKGSPLQLVLSAVYHVDAPTGNINLAEAKKIMKLPSVKKSIPLAYGDSYKSYRILGTTKDYIEKYDAKLKIGRVFKQPMEATIGETVSKKTGLKVGDTFLGTHGEAEGGHVHDDERYLVVGIFDKTNTVLDQLIITNIESVWLVHSSHEENNTIEDNHEDHNHVEDDGHHHDHDDELSHNHNEETHDHEHETESHLDIDDDDEKEITALLLEFKTKMAALTTPRIINEQTNMQSVIPALEMNRLIYMIGIGATTINYIAGGIMFMACFSIFFVLYSRLRERKYELALLRSSGYRPKHLFGLLIYEGLLLGLIGYVLGWILSRVGLYFINQQAESDFNLQFSFSFLPDEFWLFLVTIFVGIVASLLPAYQAMRMDISEILSEK